MTTSAKHIWTATANRREPAKAIFFFNQIVFLIMFLFLPKLLIRNLEDFLLRGKCNKLVCFPASLPWVLAAAGPARGGGFGRGPQGPPAQRDVPPWQIPAREHGHGHELLLLLLLLCARCHQQHQQSWRHRHRTPPRWELHLPEPRWAGALH